MYWGVAIARFGKEVGLVRAADNTAACWIRAQGQWILLKISQHFEGERVYGG